MVAIFVMCLLIGGVIYQTHKTQLNRKIYRQDKDLNELRNQLAELFGELKRENLTFDISRREYEEKLQRQEYEIELLHERATAQLHTKQKEVDEINNYLLRLQEKLNNDATNFEASQQEHLRKIERQTEEISLVRKKLQLLRSEKLLSSSITGQLLTLYKKRHSINQVSYAKEIWYQIEKEVKSVYPMFRTALLDLYPNLSDKDWQYCCFLLFKFDTNTEAVLLGINPASVSQHRTRMRNKLGISLENYSSLYEYFMNELLKD